MIRDVKIAKDIFNKEFSKFHENNLQFNDGNDDPFSKNLFFLKGDHWKATRNLLTPCFTSGKVITHL